MQAYVKDVRRKLGLEADRLYWLMTDWSKKVQNNFGRAKSTHRVHPLLSQILQAHLVSRPGKAAVPTVQAQKTLLQSALDQSGSESAMLLWSGSDPFRSEEFAGSPDEMAHVHAYRKALIDLHWITGRFSVLLKVITRCRVGNFLTGQRFSAI